MYFYIEFVNPYFLLLVFNKRKPLNISAQPTQLFVFIHNFIKILWNLPTVMLWLVYQLKIYILYLKY